MLKNKFKPTPETHSIQSSRNRLCPLTKARLGSCRYFFSPCTVLG